MVDENKVVKTRHGELTLEEIAGALPGTGDLMVTVGHEWSVCVHAARGGNFELAAFSARRTRSILRTVAVLRPKYKERLTAFEKEHLAPVLVALGAKDLAGFEAAFAAATGSANVNHVDLGYQYVHWKVPPEAGTDLELGPIANERTP